MDQADEDVLQAALLRIEILVTDAAVAQPAQQRRYAGPLRLGVEQISDLMAVRLQRDPPFGQFRRPGGKRFGQHDDQRLLAQLPIGRAACGERVFQYWWVSGGDGSLKKTPISTTT